MRKRCMNPIIRWSHRLICVSLCCLLILAGCGGQETAVPSPSPSESQSQATPVSGGSMTIVMPNNAPLKPLETTQRELVDLFSLIYDSPLQYDDTLKLQPNVVERWSLSEDGLTWTFVLRKDVTYHNGQTVKAKDVVACINELKKIDADENRDSIYAVNMDLIASAAAVDDITFTITATQKTNRVLAALVFPIIPDTAIGTSLPTGCGPYKVVSNDSGKVMELEANDSWWKRTPYLSKITVKGIQDPDTALTSMDVNLVDLVHTDSLTASGYKQPGSRDVYEVMTQEYECIIPNLQNSKMQDVQMRQAIIAALDRKTIITETYLWHAVTVDAPVPPDAYYYDQTQQQHEYNPGKATTLLGELGYQDSDGDGFLDQNGQKLTMNIIVNENTLSSARADAAKVAAQQLQKIGIDATVTVMTWSDYQIALQNGNFDLAFAGFSIPKDGDVSFLLHSTRGKYNYGRYTSATMDSYLDELAAAATEEEVKAASSKVQHLWSDELPIISLYFKTNSVVCSAKIKGIPTMRDMDIFKDIDQWYILQQGDENKANAPE